MMRCVAAGSWALGWFVLCSFTSFGLSDRPRLQEQRSDAISPASSGSTSDVEGVRRLIGELEAQTEAQRTLIARTEASLRRARALLADLERSHAVSTVIGDRSSSKPGVDPSDPMRDEVLSKQALAEKTAWAWPSETSTPEACARQFGGGYEAAITKPNGPSSPPMIHVRKDGKDVMAWHAHLASVFIRGGDMLYYAEFSPYASGCSIVAYHLKQGERWKTPLWGIGPKGNSMYTNRVNMKLDGNHLIVYGDESAGRYIELVDVRTGRIVGRRGGAGQRLK
jgi:hypothetical protein